ncbi:uncharacterized protein LOC123294241 [Chrysoperla carnea]|uniref:uncharacterized protein LOC123294241 n=1 Tax=Chrysoperla carnea TaxID=189513 RepID=UPI001D090A33|nr:uncharacterized protein LOC123294241 [Chrysoperla carnea]
MSVTTNSMILLLLAGLFIVNGEEIENPAQNKTVIKEKREYSPKTEGSNRFHYEKNTKVVRAYATSPQEQNVNQQSYSPNVLSGFNSAQYAQAGHSSGGSLQPIYVMGDLSSLLKNTQNLGSLFTGQASHMQGTTSLQNVGPVIFGSASSASSNGAAQVQANPSYGSSSQGYLQVPSNNYASSLQGHLQIPSTNYGIPSSQFPLNSYSFAKPSYSDFANSYKFPTTNFGSSSSNYNSFVPSKPYNFDSYSSGNQQYSAESLLNALKVANIGQSNSLVDTNSNLHSSPSNDNSVNYFGGHLLQSPPSSSSYHSLLSSYPHLQSLNLSPAPSFSAASFAAYKPEHLSLSHGSSGAAPVHIMMAPSSAGHGSINIMDFARSLGSNFAAYSNQPQIHASSHHGSSAVPVTYMKLDGNKFAEQYSQGPSSAEQSPQHYEGNKYAEQYSQAPSSPEQSKHYARQASDESTKVYNTIKYSEPMEAPGYMPK